MFLLVLLALSIFFGLVFAYFWARGVEVLRLQKGKTFELHSASGLPLVGVKEDQNGMNVVTFSQGKLLMVLTLKPDGTFHWNMALPDGTDVFDWNGDGLIDEQVVATNPYMLRRVRIKGEFYDLSTKEGKPYGVREGKPYVNGQEVEKKNGEWGFVE